MGVPMVLVINMRPRIIKIIRCKLLTMSNREADGLNINKVNDIFVEKVNSVKIQAHIGISLDGTLIEDYIM